MPTFNSEAFVEESIRSVLKQSEPDLELILADDGSTDGTLEVVNRLAAEDHRIVVCPPVRTGSSGAARNRGLAFARGRHIGFLDDDDLYHPQKVKQAESFLESFPDVDIVFHDYVSFSEDVNGTEGDLKQAQFSARAAGYLKEAGENAYLCDEHFYVFMSVQLIAFHTSALMFRRTLLDSGALHFREDLRVGHDIQLWLWLARRYRIAFLDQVLSYYRQRQGSLTSDAVQRIRDSIQVHTENLEGGKELFTDDQVKLCQSKLAGKYFDLGYEYFCRSERREARNAYRKSMSTDFRMRTLVAYLKTLAPEFLVACRRGDKTAS